MSTPSFARLVPCAALAAATLLVLLLPSPAAAASPAGPLAYDPFFYGEAVSVPALASTPAATAGETVPVTDVWGWVAPYDWADAPRYISFQVFDASGVVVSDLNGQTDQSGYYSMQDVPVGRSTIKAYYPNPGVELTYRDRVLVEGGNSVSFWPGAVTWTSTPGGPWSGWSDLHIVLGGRDSGHDAGTSSSQRFHDASGTGVAWSLPGELSWGQCYYGENEVSIWASEDVTPFPVMPGVLSPGAIPFAQESAARMWIVRPRWRSGNPGTVMKVRFTNWPESTRLNLTGWDASFPVTTWNDTAYDVTETPVAKTFDLKIPTAATVGKLFMTVGEGWATEHHAPTQVSTLFQTSSFKADRTRITKGRAIRLRGRVPVWEPGDTGMGTPKAVTIWARARGAIDAPAAWNPTNEGWRKVATVRTDRYGRFAAPALRPGRSTTYVCRYPGDSLHFRAYTSLVRVTVR